MFNLLTVEDKELLRNQYRVVAGECCTDGAVGARVFGVEVIGSGNQDYAVFEDVCDELCRVQELIDALVQEGIEAEQLQYAVEDFVEGLNYNF